MTTLADLRSTQDSRSTWLPLFREMAGWSFDDWRVLDEAGDDLDRARRAAIAAWRRWTRKVGKPKTWRLGTAIADGRVWIAKMPPRARR